MATNIKCNHDNMSRDTFYPAAFAQLAINKCSLIQVLYKVIGRIVECVIYIWWNLLCFRSHWQLSNFQSCQMAIITCAYLIMMSNPLPPKMATNWHVLLQWQEKGLQFQAEAVSYFASSSWYPFNLINVKVFLCFCIYQSCFFSFLFFFLFLDLDI